MYTMCKNELEMFVKLVNTVVKLVILLCRLVD